MKKLALMFGISAVNVISGLFFFPGAFEGMVDARQGVSIESTILACICFLAVMVMTAFLFREITSCTLTEGVKKVAMVYAAVGIGVILFSILSGILAVAVNAAFSESKTVGEAMSMINIAIYIFALLMSPILMSIFWAIPTSGEGFAKSILSAIKPGIKKYLMALASVIAIALAGVAINYIPNTTLGEILRTVLLIILGTAFLDATEYIFLHAERKGAAV